MTYCYVPVFSLHHGQVWRNFQCIGLPRQIMCMTGLACWSRLYQARRRNAVYYCKHNTWHSLGHTLLMVSVCDQKKKQAKREKYLYNGSDSRNIKTCRHTVCFIQLPPNGTVYLDGRRSVLQSSSCSSSPYGTSLIMDHPKDSNGCQSQCFMHLHAQGVFNVLWSPMQWFASAPPVWHPPPPFPAKKTTI